MRNLFLLVIMVVTFISCKAIKPPAEDIVSEPIWYTDMSKATELSMKEKKPLLLFFTGSDWCGWCIRLQREVLKTDNFAKWAKENVVLVELDFPRRTPQNASIKKQNFELQNIFQVRGYPTIWLANPEEKDGKINLNGLGSTGYVAGGPEKWLAIANKILKK